MGWAESDWVGRKSIVAADALFVPPATVGGRAGRACGASPAAGTVSAAQGFPSLPVYCQSPAGRRWSLRPGTGQLVSAPDRRAVLSTGDLRTQQPASQTG